MGIRTSKRTRPPRQSQEPQWTTRCYQHSRLSGPEFCVRGLLVTPRFAASASAPPAQSAQADSSAKRVVHAELAGKSFSQLAECVFEHHGCKNCHTLGSGKKLGLAERGKQVGKNFEGCISLLTAMTAIAQIKEENRSPAEKEKTAWFQEFGCTTCHQMTPGKLSLTEYGTKLASLHMACTEVEKVLASGDRRGSVASGRGKQ